MFLHIQVDWAKMRVAIIGQSQFAGEVYKLLQKNGHKIAGVFTIPDLNGRADPLGTYKIARVELWLKPRSYTNDYTFSRWLHQTHYPEVNVVLHFSSTRRIRRNSCFQVQKMENQGPDYSRGFRAI